MKFEQVPVIRLCSVHEKLLSRAVRKRESVTNIFGSKTREAVQYIVKLSPIDIIESIEGKYETVKA